MRRKRRTYQFGWLERQERNGRPAMWLYRYREMNAEGDYRKRCITLGSVEEFPSEALAWRAAEHLRMCANPDEAFRHPVTFGALVDRYLAEELPELRHSTASAYRSYVENHIRSKWADYGISDIKPFAVEEWLKKLDLASKSKGQIHTIMRSLFNSAMRGELIRLGENPMKLVRVRGISKREREPRVLTLAELRSLLGHIQDEPFRTMVVLDMATGLRASELLALKWCDVNWSDLTLSVRRAIVDGVTDDVKTKCSKAGLPLDPALGTLLRGWKSATEFNREEDWVFASPFQAGKKPYRAWGVQQRRIAPAAAAAGLGEGIGWHTFRHTFRTLLDESGAPLKVQQELMRHADIRTTMNVYGKAMDESKRRAHSEVVRLVLARA
jgi:integrase